MDRHDIALLKTAMVLKKAMKKEAIGFPVLNAKKMNPLTQILGFSAATVGFAELLRAIKKGVAHASHKGQEEPRWRKFIKRFPQFAEEDKDVNREIFGTIHELAPTVSKNPTMAAQMLHAAKEYGLPGLDVNTARALADLEGAKYKVWDTRTGVKTDAGMAKSLASFLQNTR